jgi:hypothetical protein
MSKNPLIQACRFLGKTVQQVEMHLHAGVKEFMDMTVPLPVSKHRKLSLLELHRY